MKLIAIGDIHGRAIWKDIVNKEVPDKVIFVGDYFDSFNICSEYQINNFLDICQYKKSSGVDVTMLIGNHDIHYFREIGDTSTSGYQIGPHIIIEHTIDNNKDCLQMAEYEGDILFTHAGVSKEWLEDFEYEGNINAKDISEFVNDVWKYKPMSFLFRGVNPYGDDTYQTPIWIRPRSLMKSCQSMKKQLIQVVGHTYQNSIDIEGKSTGGRYFFIDTLDNLEYLVIEDGNIKLGKLP